MFFQIGVRTVFVLLVLSLVSIAAVHSETSAVSVLATAPENGRIYVPVVGRPLLPDVPGDLDQIVYETGSRNTVITTIRADGSGKLGLTWPTVNNYSPAWSPDRRLIAYVHETSSPSTGYQLTIMKANGREVQALPTTHLDLVVDPTWSPDGGTLIFSGYENGPGWDLYRIGVDGSDLTNLTLDLEDDAVTPDWAPDGSRVAFMYDGNQSEAFELWTMNPDGSDKKNIGADDGDFMFPEWSPDSQTILFLRIMDNDNYVIHTQAISGGLIQSVVESGYDAEWSPTGEAIVFTGKYGGLFRYDFDSQLVTPVDADIDARAADW